MQSNDIAPGFAADLLRSVAEQLKVPLTIIARQTELIKALEQFEPTDASQINTQATVALALVDSYLLGLQLLGRQQQLPLEPVSLSSMLADMAHDLYKLSKQHNVDLELAIAGKYAPVMANQQCLRAAFLSLGYGFVEAHSQPQTNRPHRLTLALHRTPRGMVAGAYGAPNSFGAGQWRTALELYGKASQPCASLGSGSGAGLFVADSILRSMHTRLRVGRHNKRIGLAATFQVSRQLALV